MTLRKSPLAESVVAADADAARLGDHRRVDVRHLVLDDIGEQALERRELPDAHVVLGDPHRRTSRSRCSGTARQP